MALKRSRFAPWAAASAGTLGWAVHQQLLGDIQHFRCAYLGPWFGIGVTLAVLLFIAAGCMVTLAARDIDAGESRRFVVRFSLSVAALFLLPIVLQAGATLMLPPCLR